MKPVMRSLVRSIFLLTIVTNFFACTEQVAEKPNIIFIFSDDHAYQAVRQVRTHPQYRSPCY